MSFTQLFSLSFQLNCLDHDGIVAMPLHKISPAHEGAVL